MAGAANFVAYVVTCEERRAIFEATLAKFRGTDWGCDPELQVDDGAAPDKLARIHATWLKALDRVAAGPADFGLILEDDLDFNVHLRRNLTGWGPVQGRDGNTPFLGSIYNADNRPASLARSEAVLLHRAPAPVLGRAGDRRLAPDGVVLPQTLERGGGRRRSAHAASRGAHLPRLHARAVAGAARGRREHLGGPFHQARDFDQSWKAA